MGAKPAWLSALVGVWAAQVLPWLTGPQGLTVRAAWCWSAKPPWCDVPTVTDGSCLNPAGAAVTSMAAGDTCTPSCAEGKVPVGSCSLKCPVSGVTDTEWCRDDLEAGTWWDPCGGGDVCLEGISIGIGQWSNYGNFECVDETDERAAESCNAVKVEPDGLGPATQLDIGASAGLGALVLAMILSGILSRAAGGNAKLWSPGWYQWNLGNLIGCTFVLVVVVLMILALPTKDISSGIAAGLSSLAVMAWTTYKLSVATLVGVTREAAWRIHYTFGFLSIVAVIVHYIFVRASGKNSLSNPFWFLGLVGGVLMCVPALLLLLPQSVMKYDLWKLLHYCAPAGYAFAVVHMLEHGLARQAVASWLIAIINITMLLVWCVDKAWKASNDRKVTVVSADLISETCGQHLFMTLNVPGFDWKPGQWGHLSVPVASLVRHPFTIVPGDGDGNLRIFMKIGSDFTARVAKEFSGPFHGPYTALTLGGPHGIPAIPSPHVQAVAFVLGGVGVTPALSLVAEAAKIYRTKPVVFWSLRSVELLRRSAPMMEPHVELAWSCLQLNGEGTAQGDNLPLDAKYSDVKVSDWLSEAGKHFKGDGINDAMIFVCGPMGLSDAAKEAARKNTEVNWHVHVEEFLFLPPMPRCGQRKPVKPSGAKAEPTLLGTSGSSPAPASS